MGIPPKLTKKKEGSELDKKRRKLFENGVRSCYGKNFGILRKKADRGNFSILYFCWVHLATLPAIFTNLSASL